jgi:glycosyltransferase involved in cell wall biosynthesis
MLALSLIIPVKNEENNLVHLCQSLSVQEFKDYFEVIIVILIMLGMWIRALIF